MRLVKKLGRSALNVLGNGFAQCLHGWQWKLFDACSQRDPASACGYVHGHAQFPEAVARDAESDLLVIL